MGFIISPNIFSYLLMKGVSVNVGHLLLVPNHMFKVSGHLERKVHIRANGNASAAQ